MALIKSLNDGTISVPTEISDHRCTNIYLPFNDVLTTTVKRKVWLYKRGDYEKLNDKILNTNWDFINNSSIDVACSLFTNLILNYMD